MVGTSGAAAQRVLARTANGLDLAAAHLRQRVRRLRAESGRSGRPPGPGSRAPRRDRARTGQARAGLLLEVDAAQMRGAAPADRRHRGLVRVGLEPGDQLLEVVRRKVGSCR